MNTPAPRSASAPGPFAAHAHGTAFLPRLFRLAGAYWNSQERWKVRALTLALLLLVLSQVMIAIWTNLWFADFFDALEQKNAERFVSQIGMFGLIVLSTMLVTAAHVHTKRTLQLGWRRWLVRRLTGEWMAEARHYYLSYVPGHLDNPDGRIADDIRKTTEDAIELANSLLYCGMLLASFVGILWSLSGPFIVKIGDMTIPIPGYLVWISFAYAAVGSFFALRIGNPLVRATDRFQSTEQRFRFGLVRARENTEAIALLRGESDERLRFTSLFRSIETAWKRVTRKQGWLYFFSSGYSTLATVFPILITAPRYFTDTITLGGMMQTAQAFQQVTAALSWPVDNAPKIAEWRASVQRVLALHDALEDIREDLAHVDDATIRVEPANGPSLAFRGVSVATPDGKVLFSDIDAEIQPGERVLIDGEASAAATLFKVAAGLWPWGRGRVELPDNATVFFMPERPYFPIGTLRNALRYPSDGNAHQTEEIVGVLQRVGLAHLIERLDHAEAWDHALTAGEQQRLGFARLLLHRPRWIFLEEATDALDPDGEAEMMELLRREFSDATVLTVGHHDALAPFHERRLSLERSETGALILKQTRARRTAMRPPAPALDARTPADDHD